jgi:hypothetical protein
MDEAPITDDPTDTVRDAVKPAPPFTLIDPLGAVESGVPPAETVNETKCGASVLRFASMDQNSTV